MKEGKLAGTKLDALGGRFGPVWSHADSSGHKPHAHKSCVLQQGSITKVLALLTAGCRQRPLTLSTRPTCHRERDQEARAFSMTLQSYFILIFVVKRAFLVVFVGKGCLVDLFTS